MPGAFKDKTPRHRRLGGLGLRPVDLKDICPQKETHLITIVYGYFIIQNWISNASLGQLASGLYAWRTGARQPM
ncbi:hypothetical protein LMIY3S_01895 [Labrys miyagiensis]